MCYDPVFILKVPFPLPCGKCLGCALDYTNMWSIRILDEAKQYKDNCFITLTYADTDGVLHKEDLQKFIKRLRKRISPIKIRYFACGEYGGKFARPHFHLILFNYIPDDLEFFYKKDDNTFYKSEFLSEVWGNGFITVTNLTADNVRYCTKYMTKLDDRPHKVKPFTVMSRKPGIGANTVNLDMLLSGTVFMNGRQLPVPKFYLDKLEQQGYNVDMIKSIRQYIARERTGEYIDYESVAEKKKAYKNRIKEMKLHKK